QRGSVSAPGSFGDEEAASRLGMAPVVRCGHGIPPFRRSGGVGPRAPHAQTPGHLTTDGEQGAVHHHDGVTRGGPADRAELAAGEETALQQRLHLVGGEVDPDELDRLPEGDVGETELVAGRLYRGSAHRCSLRMRSSFNDIPRYTRPAPPERKRARWVR